MRILQLHSNFIVFKPVEKEINNAEEAEKVETRVEEVVVLFTAIEESDNPAMAQKAIDDVRALPKTFRGHPLSDIACALKALQPKTAPEAKVVEKDNRPFRIVQYCADVLN